MGYEVNDAVLVTSWAFVKPGDPRERWFPGVRPPDIEGFRASMPEGLRHLLVGPIPHAINGGATYMFGPDGSKEGWDLSNAADEWRQRFMDLFAETYEDGSSPFDVVHIRYGHDVDEEGGARIIYANDEHHDSTIRAAADSA